MSNLQDITGFGLILLGGVVLMQILNSFFITRLKNSKHASFFFRREVFEKHLEYSPENARLKLFHEINEVLRHYRSYARVLLIVLLSFLTAVILPIEYFIDVFQEAVNTTLSLCVIILGIRIFKVLKQIKSLNKVKEEMLNTGY